jgi:hypothetical protein
MKNILFYRALNFSLNQSDDLRSSHSTDSSANNEHNKVMFPVKYYGNADTMKRLMSLENKGKAGIVFNFLEFCIHFVASFGRDMKSPRGYII